MEHWYLHPAICVYSWKPDLLHVYVYASAVWTRPPRIRAFIRLQGVESRCTQRWLAIGSRPQVWPIAYRWVDRPIPRVLANPISHPIVPLANVDYVDDEMACLLSTSRENIIDVARRKAQGESPRFNIGNIDSILETCQWGTTLDSKSRNIISGGVSFFVKNQLFIRNLM